MDDETEWIIVETDSDSVRTTKEELVAEDFVLGNEVPVAIDDGNYWGDRTLIKSSNTWNTSNA